ncbi:MAG: hypothetical protein FJ150_03695 [Euryarchaeota archaeon]|nr:hypothetical protein [Euryarchaeota archaeon]
MGPLELFTILVLAGAVVVLLYYYMQDTRTGPSLQRVKTHVTGIGEKVYKGEGSTSGVSEKIYGVSEKIKGKVREVPISTDIVSTRVESFLNEQSDQLIKDWELATQTDIESLRERLDKTSHDIDELGRRFDEYKGYTNKKITAIEKRLESLETEEEKEQKSE